MDRHPAETHDNCRICLCEAEQPDLSFIMPCLCTGSQGYVHQDCLEQWMKSSNTRYCQVCKFRFIMHTEIKPITEWNVWGKQQRSALLLLTMDIIGMMFHVWYLYCVINYLYSGELQLFKQKILEDAFYCACVFIIWPLFLIIMGKHQFKRWLSFNTNFYVQNVPGQSNQEVCSGTDPLTTTVLGGEEMSSDENEFHSSYRHNTDCNSSNSVEELEAARRRGRGSDDRRPLTRLR